MHPARAPAARRLPRPRRVPARALPRPRARARTRGSRSAAACDAASARRSPRWRCRSCCARSPSGCALEPVGEPRADPPPRDRARARARRRGACARAPRLSPRPGRALSARAAPSASGSACYRLASARLMAPELYVQRDQPPGVPPLRSTASARCPTCPRRTTGSSRHLAVYEWIAAQRRTAAGSSTWRAARATAPTVLAARAASVVGVDANPDAFEHARLRYTRARTCASSATWSSSGRATCDCVVFLQTIEHVQDPDAVLEHFARCSAPGGVGVRLDAERADARAEGRRALGQPVARARVPAARSSARCARATSPTSSCSACSTRASCARTRWRSSALGWDAIHARLGLTRALLRPLHAGDLRARLRAARRARPRPRARPRRGAAPVSRRPPGDRPAHPHALRRGLRDVAVRRGVAVGGDRDVVRAAARRARPRRAGHAVADARCSCDQLEAPGALDRCRAFLADVRPASHRLDAEAARASRRRGRRARARARRRRLRARARTRCRPTRSPRCAPHAAWTSAATHAVLPLLATDAGVRLQVRTGIAAHRARFGAWRGGFWLPECALRAVARPAARGGGRPRGRAST